MRCQNIMCREGHVDSNPIADNSRGRARGLRRSRGHSRTLPKRGKDGARTSDPSWKCRRTTSARCRYEAAATAATLACRPPVNTFDPRVLIALVGDDVVGSIVMNVTFPAFQTKVIAPYS